MRLKERFVSEGIRTALPLLGAAVPTAAAGAGAGAR